jgi:hypothetical protein
MKGYRRRIVISPFILNFGTIRRRVVNFTLRPLYSRETRPIFTE